MTGLNAKCSLKRCHLPKPTSQTPPSPGSNGSACQRMLMLPVLLAESRRGRGPLSRTLQHLQCFPLIQDLQDGHWECQHGAQPPEDMFERGCSASSCDCGQFKQVLWTFLLLGQTWAKCMLGGHCQVLDGAFVRKSVLTNKFLDLYKTLWIRTQTNRKCLLSPNQPSCCIFKWI